MEKSKMGRPPMEPSKRRSKVMRIRLNEAERKWLEREARRSGLTLSAVIREKLKKGE